MWRKEQKVRLGRGHENLECQTKEFVLNLYPIYLAIKSILFSIPWPYHMDLI